MGAASDPASLPVHQDASCCPDTPAHYIMLFLSDKSPHHNVKRDRCNKKAHFQMP